LNDGRMRDLPAIGFVPSLDETCDDDGFGMRSKKLISGDLILGNLVSSEPLDKLCQSDWEGSLDRTAGNP
jgi:hypothetical protein